MGPIIHAFLIYILTKMVGDYQDPAVGWKALLVVIVSGSAEIWYFMTHRRDDNAETVSTLLALGIAVVLLLAWCRVSLVSTLKIVAIFLVLHFGFAFLIRALQS